MYSWQKKSSTSAANLIHCMRFRLCFYYNLLSGCHFIVNEFFCFVLSRNALVHSRLLILFVRFKTSQFVVGIFCQCHYTVRIEFMFHRCQSSCVIEVHYTAKDRREWNCLLAWLSGRLSKRFWHLPYNGYRNLFRHRI